MDGRYIIDRWFIGDWKMITRWPTDGWWTDWWQTDRQSDSKQGLLHVEAGSLSCQRYWHLGSISPAGWGHPGPCRVLTSISGLYPLKANSTLYPQLWQPKMSPGIVRCPLAGGQGTEIIPYWELLMWNDSVRQNLFPLVFWFFQMYPLLHTLRF